ncbi:hypothetical protein VTJ04DRAFT_4404 [Mycothermus thermophilus]|uniref:uncharacterized protein n=1 Tax=Humicola insolens TaxID=85995 RepID=UPI00374246DE
MGAKGNNEQGLWKGRSRAFGRHIWGVVCGCVLYFSFFKCHHHVTSQMSVLEVQGMGEEQTRHCCTYAYPLSVMIELELR